MKKILLGIAILSAMVYAQGAPELGTTTPTDTSESINSLGTTGVQILTKATVTTSGLIIATKANDTYAKVTSLELDHGDIGVADKNLDATTTQKEFHIKRADNNERLGRAGYTLTVTLNHDGILKHENYSSTTANELGKDSKAKLNHNLELKFPSKGALDITTNHNDGNSSYTKFTSLSNEDSVITGKIASIITADQTNAPLAGNYVNDALITVTISKPVATL